MYVSPMDQGELTRKAKKGRGKGSGDGAHEGESAEGESAEGGGEDMPLSAFCL